MWSPFAESPPRSVRPLVHELVPPVGEVRRDLDPDVGHQPLGFGHQALHVLDRDLRRPARHRLLVAQWRAIPRPARPRRRVRDLSDLAAVVARMGDEVLEDHLLDVPVPRMRRRQCLERRDPLVLRLADPDQDSGREGDSKLAGRVDRRHPHGGVLRRRARVDGFHQTLRDRLQHQALRRRHLAQPRQIVAVQGAQVRVRQQAALERSLAGPGHVRDEVVVPVGAEALADAGVHLRPLAREDEELLRVAPQRLVETLLDLSRRVEVCLPSRERAVLAYAPTRPRQRKRVVARERDAPHGAGRYLLRARTSASLTAWPTARASEVGGSAPSANWGPAITNR